MFKFGDIVAYHGVEHDNWIHKPAVVIQIRDGERVLIRFFDPQLNAEYPDGYRIHNACIKLID